MAKLYHFRLCPLSRSIRLALAELRLEAELVEERPWEWREELLALNPSGELPIYCPDGDGPICGAYAISEHLAESVPASPGSAQIRLLPPAARSRSEVRRLVEWFNAKLYREATLPLLEEKVYTRFDPSGRKPDSEALRTARAALRYHLGYIEFLAHDRSWLGGEEASYADFCAAGQLSSLDYLDEVDWNDRNHARQWYARMKSRPSLRMILAERVPGAPLPPSHYADPDF